MRRVVLGHHEQAGRHAVDAVHDARAQRPAHLGERAKMVQQPVDERARGVPRRGMHHEPLRLVDHADVRVLIHDVERHGLGPCLDLHRLGRQQAHLVARHERMGRARARAVDRDRALADQPLRLAAREAGRLRHKAVQPRRRVRREPLLLTHDRRMAARPPPRPLPRQGPHPARAAAPRPRPASHPGRARARPPSHPGRTPRARARKRPRPV